MHLFRLQVSAWLARQFTQSSCVGDLYLSIYLSIGDEDRNIVSRGGDKHSFLPQTIAQTDNETETGDEGEDCFLGQRRVAQTAKEPYTGFAA